MKSRGNDVRRSAPKALATLAGQAFPVRRLQLVTDVTVRCQLQPLFRHRRPGDACFNELVKDMPESTEAEINRSIKTFIECLED